MAITINQGAGNGASWMKKGSASAAVAQQEAVEAEKRKAEQGLMWRYYLAKGEEGKMTFVDGDLSPEGFLLPPRYYEHSLYLNGSYNNHFVCPEKTNPESGDKCPICEDPNERPSLVALFTVIDHREFKSKDNKVYKDRPKLLVVKSQSFEMLNKIATKLGGLAGQTFDVSRSNNDKSPAIGDVYFPSGPKGDLKQLYQQYMVEKVIDAKTNQKAKVSLFVPADYEKEIVYRSGDELRKMGFGKPTYTGASGPGMGSAQPADDEFAKNL